MHIHMYRNNYRQGQVLESFIDKKLINLLKYFIKICIYIFKEMIISDSAIFREFI